MNSINIEELKKSKPIYLSQSRVIYRTMRLSVVDSLKVFSIQELNEKILNIMNNIGHDYPHIYCFKGFHIDQEHSQNEETEENQPKSWIRIYFERPDVTETLLVHLEKRLKAKSYFKFEILLEYSFILINCLAYLHSKKITHSNLAKESVLFDNYGNLRLGYISSSNLPPAGNEDIIFSKITPPEEVNQKIEKNYFGDMWNLGILLLEMATLERIDPQKISHKEINNLLEDVKITYPVEYAEFLKNLLQIEPLKRWSADYSFKYIEEKIAQKYKVSLRSVVTFKDFEENTKYLKEKEKLFSNMDDNFILKKSKVQQAEEEKIAKIEDSSEIFSYQISEPSYFQTDKPKLLHFFQPKSKVLHLIDISNKSKSIIFQRIELDINFLIPRWHRSLVTPNGDIFLFGGADVKNGNKKFNGAYIYDPNGLVLRGFPNMRVARSNHSVVYFKGFIYIIGGESIEGKTVGECERINLKTKIWEQIPKLQIPVKDAMACTFDEKYIYVIGGKTDDTTLSQSIQRLDLEFLQWQIIEFFIPDLLKKLNFNLLSLGSACQINKDCIYIAGGSYCAPDEEKSSQTFLLKVDLKENIHQIMGYNKYKLPVEDCFWNPQIVIDNQSIYALQNVSHEVEKTAVYLDRKRILKFNSSNGWMIYE